MGTTDLVHWFHRYLDDFAACGRGQMDPSSLLDYYGIPLLLSTDDGFVALGASEDVVAMAQRQVDGMRAADYDHSEVIDLKIEPLNSVSALCRGKFSRQRADGGEIGRLAATYLIAGASVDRRIHALAVHSP